MPSTPSSTGTSYGMLLLWLLCGSVMFVFTFIKVEKYLRILSRHAALYPYFLQATRTLKRMWCSLLILYWHNRRIKSVSQIEITLPSSSFANEYHLNLCWYIGRFTLTNCSRQPKSLRGTLKRNENTQKMLGRARSKIGSLSVSALLFHFVSDSVRQRFSLFSALIFRIWQKTERPIISHLLLNSTWRYHIYFVVLCCLYSYLRLLLFCLLLGVVGEIWRN